MPLSILSHSQRHEYHSQEKNFKNSICSAQENVDSSVPGRICRKLPVQMPCAGSPALRPVIWSSDTKVHLVVSPAAAAQICECFAGHTTTSEGSEEPHGPGRQLGLSRRVSGTWASEATALFWLLGRIRCDLILPHQAIYILSIGTYGGITELPWTPLCEHLLCNYANKKGEQHVKISP